MDTDLSQSPDIWSGKPLVSLMDHIVTTHHTFCRQEVARVGSLFKEVIASHGKDHPELKQGAAKWVKKLRQDYDRRLGKVGGR